LDVTQATVIPHIEERVLPASTVYTDEYATYNPLVGKGYRHKRIQHKQRVYVSGDVHTNTIEGFWSLVKRGLGGVYHSVSRKQLEQVQLGAKDTQISCLDFAAAV